ncbi:MAG TPA: hypothetical protein VG412_01385 [Acidimicrobiales bacterium]|nr:hypothetical protein [Acidimicrobiales bacterium]
MSSPDESLVSDAAPGMARDLRTNCFAAVVMLVIEFGLGMWTNIYANLPAVDRGRGMFAAFGHAVADGPVGLSLHAIVGTLLVVTGVSAVVRAALTRSPLSISVTGVALLAILAAWSSGARFVGDMSKGPSLTMAIATGVALLCYVVLLFVPPGALSRRRPKG